MLLVPFRVEDHISVRRDEKGGAWTVVLQKSTPLPADVVARGGSFATASGDPVRVLEGDQRQLLAPLRQQFRKLPPARPKLVRAVARLVGEERAESVASFLRAYPVPSRSVVRCVQMLLALAASAAVFQLPFIAAAVVDESSSTEAIRQDVVLQATLAVMLSLGMSKTCAVISTLLLVLAMYGSGGDMKRAVQKSALVVVGLLGIGFVQRSLR